MTLSPIEPTDGARTRKLAVAIVCFAIAGWIVASETGHCAEKVKTESALKLTALYGGAVGLELGATEYALAKDPHVREGNPLMQNRGVRIGASVVSTAALVCATKSLQAHEHPGTARWMKRLVVAARVVLAFHDWRQAR